MSEWIKHDGGECPVEPSVRVDAVESSGVERINFLAKDIDWSKECKSKRNYLIVKYRLYTPNPNEKWVKIQPGCPMPEVGEYIDVYLKNGDRMMYRYVDEKSDSMMSVSSHWRYPHPDPVD